MTKPRFYPWLLAAFAGLLLLPSCQTNRSISTSNLFNIYRAKAYRIHPDFLVYHLNDSVSRIHFRVAAEELLYVKKDEEPEPSARIKFSYRLYPSYESGEFLDSASFSIRDFGVADPGRDIMGHFDIPIAYASDYLVGGYHPRPPPGRKISGVPQHLQEQPLQPAKFLVAPCRLGHSLVSALCRKKGRCTDHHQPNGRPFARPALQPGVSHCPCSFCSIQSQAI